MSDTDTAETIPDLVARALDAYADLLAIGEGIDDEWSYVNDLGSAWGERLEAAAAAHPDVTASAATRSAIDAVIDEAARIRDPHRAIDWLSTFPQVVLLALGAER